MCAARNKKEAKRLAAIAAHEVLDAEVSPRGKAPGDKAGRAGGGQGGGGKGGQRGRGGDTDEAPQATGKRKRGNAAGGNAAGATSWNAAVSGTAGYGAALVSMATGYAGMRVLAGGKDATAGASTKGYGGASGGLAKLAKIASPEPRVASSAAKPATGGYGGAAGVSAQASPGAGVDKPRAVAAPQVVVQTSLSTPQATESVGPLEPESKEGSAAGVPEASGGGQDSDEEEGEIR